jgi:hypothetical protein
MTDDATRRDPEFERDLRAMLAGRDPGPAPSTLAGSIRSRLGNERAPGRLTGLIRVAAAAAILVATIVVVAFVAGRPIDTGPAATPSPVAAARPIQAGDGIADPTFTPVAQSLAWIAVVVGLAALALRARRRRIAIAATLAIVALVWGAANLGTSEALSPGGAWGVGPVSEAQPDPDAPGVFLGVEGDQPFHVVFTVTNDSPWPLELRGLVSTHDLQVDAPPLVPRFVALGAFPTPNLIVDDVVPFRPTTLAPGDRTFLFVLGLAGSCALAAPFEGREASGSTSVSTVDLVYEQLTIVHTQQLELDEPVNVWWPDSCT